MRPARISLALFALLLSACGVREPISQKLTIELGEAQAVRATAVTEITQERMPKAMHDRVEVFRDALIGGRDEWALRFATIEAEQDRVTFEKRRGTLHRVERSVIFHRDDLQRVFSDLPITAMIVQGAGWEELSLYAGESTRATREQKERVEKILRLWSEDAARYFQAIDHLYSYLDGRPDRAEILFGFLTGEREGRLIDQEEEQALIDGVNDAMARMIQLFDAASESAYSADEEFDLVFNPFPAEIVIKTPRPILQVENFTRRDDKQVLITRAGLFDAIEALDGHWVSPDPLAMTLRSEREDREPPTAKELAALERHSTSVVTAKQISDKVVELLRSPHTYKVRWRL